MIWNLIIRSLISCSIAFHPIAFAATHTDSSDIHFSDEHTSNALSTANQFNQISDSLYNNVFRKNNPRGYFLNHPLDIYSLIHQKTSPHKDIPFVDHKKITVEILDSKNQVQAVIGNKKFKSVFLQLFSSLYKGEHWITKKQKTHTFRIRFQDQILHTFANHVQWMGFLGPYLVFMEPGQIHTNNQAFVSFIDLNFFESAIGKTALPVFRIPLSVSSFLKNLLLNPHSIDASIDSSNSNKLLTLNTEKGIQYSFNLFQLNHLSRLQQTSFNIIVSLVSVDRYENDFHPFIKDIIKTVQESSEATLNKSSSSASWTQSHDMLINLLSEEIKQRGEIGSSKNLLGYYGHLKQSQMELDQLNQTIEELADVSPVPINFYKKVDSHLPKEEHGVSYRFKKFYNKFLNHLNNDQAFQSLLSQVANDKFQTKKILARLKGLFLYLTKPQPLGAAKIQTALGILSTSLDPKSQVEDRFVLFKEGMSRIVANQKVRTIAIPTLVGASYLAHPVIADFYHQILHHGAQWFYRWGDLISVTTEKSTSFLDPQKLHQTYIADDNYKYLLKGFTALMTITFSIFGSLHIIINAKQFIQHLKSREYKINQEVSDHLLSKWLKQIRYWKTEYIKYIHQTSQNFIKNISNMEWRKVGLKMNFFIPGTTEPISTFFQTKHSWFSFLKNYEHKTRNININILVDNIPVIKMVSNKETESYSPKEELIMVQFHPLNTNPKSRHFIVQGDGDFNMIFDQKDGFHFLKDNVSMQLIETSQKKNNGDTSIVSGSIINGQFTPEEESLVQSVLQEIQSEKKQKYFSKISNMDLSFSHKEVNTFSKALVFLFHYSNWTYTMNHLINYWNQFFLFRNLLWRPSAGVRVLYYTNYFNRIIEEDHFPTVLNGGFEKKFSFSKVDRNSLSAKKYLEKIKKFEKQIINIERNYWRASMEQGLLNGIDSFLQKGVSSQAGQMIATGVKRNPEGHAREYSSENPITNVGLSFKGMNKKQYFFMEFYVRELFNESMRSFIRDQFRISPSLSDKQVRDHLVEKIKNGSVVSPALEDMEQVRHRVRAVNNAHNIDETVAKVINKMFSFKKFLKKNQLKAERLLDPNGSIVMQRYAIAKEGVKDSEALARVTRYQLAKVIVDKPIELLILFLVLAGVDQGILKVLHKEAFSEDSLFHLSRVAVWSGFMQKLMFDLLGQPWMKIQMDSRLGFHGLFDNVPSKKDFDQKFPTIRAYWKYWNSPDNTLLANYRFVWKMIVANIGAAVVTYGAVYAVTLGRFDADLFLNMFLMAILPALALEYKSENAFEQMANFSLKDLIKKGLDFKTHKHLLAHPDIQQFRIKQSNALRKRFNIFYAFIYNNPMENISRVFQNIDTQHGTRFFQRQWLFGSTLTEYWVSLMNRLESIGVPSKITKACKLVFTNNRTDLMNE